MTKGKERPLKELYDVTEKILEPEITPVLKGSCRIQGPMDETDHKPQKNTETSLVEKKFGRHSVSEQVRMRAESGTCNVCAAPCSSCMHFNRTVPCMELKAENDFSDETSRGKVASRCSFNDANVPLPFKNRACRDQHHTVSESSNLIGASSSHDSLSENAESMCVTGRSLVISSSSRVASDVDEKNILNQYEEPKVVECHGDNISCVSGANNANIPVGDLNVDLKSKRPRMFVKESLQMDPTVGLLHKPGPSEVPSSKDFCMENSSEKVWSPYAHSRSGQSLIPNADAKDLGENSCSHRQDEPSECSMEHVESSLAKLATSDSVSAEKSTTHNCNNILLKFENSKSSSPRSGMDIEDSPAESVKCSDLNKQDERSSSLPEVPDIQEPPSQSQLVDESNGADILEDDVKVCDICGDAGREDLLAICSKCNDGAEHTYCMRIMMDKVPEHDWLCEVCQLKEEAENQKQDKFETVLGTSKASCVNEKSQNSGGILSSKVSPKLDIKLPEGEAKGGATKVDPSPRFPSKRHSNNLEIAPEAKRQGLETSTGSPKPSSPSKKAVLSRESSFKNLDKGKIKPIQRILSSGGSATNNSQDTAHSPTTSDHNLSRVQSQLHSPWGALSKSKSFNTLNSKPKVKLIHEDFSQKRKLARNTATNETKREGLVRTISKSLSFKTGSLNSNSVEPKAKLLSSNLSRSEDPRGLKLAKEKNLIDRKNSFKSERSLVSTKAGSNVPSPKTEQKIASRGETMPLLSSANNNRDLKAVQPDGKLNTSSKVTSLPTSRGSETPNSFAGRHDVKRQSSSLSCGVGSTSLNGMHNSAVQRPSQVSPKDETVVNSSYTADGPCNSDAVVQRKSVCPDGGTRVLETSGAISSREVTNESKSKDAVENALLNRSETYTNSRMPDQSDDLSMSSTELSSEVASKDQPSNSSYFLRNLICIDGMYDGQDSVRCSTADSSKILTEAECEPRSGCSDVITPLDGSKFKLSMSDSSISSRVLSIPEHDCIWQGGFEVQRIGRLTEFCDGIQAHLSTCASPKVVEVVNKFPCKFVLEEVPRLNAWPSQFKNCATEDNIALYFFAKDLESYARSYKSLLENMIKNDFALKGNFDGIELLIFPSNQLPEKSQCWNMLFFLWGVFRGKRVNCEDHTPRSCKNFSGANLNVVPLEEELPTPAMAVSQEECMNIDKDLATGCKSQNALEAIKSAASMNFPIFSSSGRLDTNCYKEGSPLNQKCLGLETNSSPGLSVLDTSFSSRITTSDAQPCEEMKGNGTSMEEHGNLDNRDRMELGVCSQATRQNSCLRKGKTVKMHSNSSNFRQAGFPSTLSDRQETSSVSPSFAAQEVSGSMRSIVEGKVQERMKDCSVYEVKQQELLKCEEVTIDADFARECDPAWKEHCSSEFKRGRKRPCLDYLDMASQASVQGDVILVDGESEHKKLRKCYSDIYGSNSSREQNSWSQIHNEDCRDPVFPENLRTTERYFFPINVGPSECGPGSSSIPLQVISSDDEEDQLESDVPSLELALGAEKSRRKQGIMPLFATLANEKSNQGKCQDPVTGPPSDDDLLASLSLSLAFPFSDKEQTVKPVSKPEQLLPERCQVDTSLMLFRSFSDT